MVNPNPPNRRRLRMRSDPSTSEISEQEEMAGSLEWPEQKPTDDDKTRRRIAYSLLLLVAALALLAPILVATDTLTTTEMGELLDKTFTPIIALAGSAIGFYFGQGRDRRN